MAKTAKTAGHAIGEVTDAIDSVLHQKSKRIEVDGADFILVIYRLNDQIPVRIDFKRKTK